MPVSRMHRHIRRDDGCRAGVAGVRRGRIRRTRTGCDSCRHTGCVRSSPRMQPIRLMRCNARWTGCSRASGCIHARTLCRRSFVGRAAAACRAVGFRRNADGYRSRQSDDRDAGRRDDARRVSSQGNRRDTSRHAGVDQGRGDGARRASARQRHRRRCQCGHLRVWRIRRRDRRQSGSLDARRWHSHDARRTQCWFTAMSCAVPATT